MIVTKVSFICGGVTSHNYDVHIGQGPVNPTTSHPYLLKTSTSEVAIINCATQAQECQNSNQGTAVAISTIIQTLPTSASPIKASSHGPHSFAESFQPFLPFLASPLGALNPR